MHHMFSVEAASMVGVEAAIILNNMAFWCLHNLENNMNIKDGMAWTYNSIAALKNLFPYLSQGKIRRAVETLVGCGAIVVGSYSEDKRDRTKWYAVTEYGFAVAGFSGCVQKQQMHLLKSTNAIDEADKSNNIYIYDIRTDINTDKKAHERTSDNGLDALFDEFWKAYPRKANKPAAKKAFKRISPSRELLDKMLAAISWFKRSPEWAQDSGQFIPYPSSWLNGERWNDMEQGGTDSEDAARRPEMPLERAKRTKRDEREALAQKLAEGANMSLREARVKFGLQHPDAKVPAPCDILSGKAAAILDEAKRLNAEWERDWLEQHPEWRE